MASVRTFGKLAARFPSPRTFTERRVEEVSSWADIRIVKSGRGTSKCLPFYENIDITEQWSARSRRADVDWGGRISDRSSAVGVNAAGCRKTGLPYWERRRGCTASADTVAGSIPPLASPFAPICVLRPMQAGVSLQEEGRYCSPLDGSKLRKLSRNKPYITRIYILPSGQLFYGAGERHRRVQLALVSPPCLM